jgi:hypothetical protein
VERALVEQGWRLAHSDPYDQRYYREWGHEIPSLLHPHRQTPIDLHHTIAPLTSRAHPDADALVASSIAALPPRLRCLGAPDMVLHSTLHLFNDEVGRPLRDLFDIHLLLVHFGSTPRFWDDLLARAELHGVGRPVYYMLRQAHATFGTDVPAEVLASARRWRPRASLDWGMERIFRTRFAADGALGRQLRYRVVRRAHYVRAHWLRMPPMLLASHLSRKAVRRLRERLARATPDTDNATA